MEGRRGAILDDLSVHIFFFFVCLVFFIFRFIHLDLSSYNVAYFQNTSKSLLTFLSLSRN